MDPAIKELMHDISVLQSQVVGLQANMEWLMKLAWLLVAANVGNIILGGLQIKKNNGANKK